MAETDIEIQRVDFSLRLMGEPERLEPLSRRLCGIAKEHLPLALEGISLGVGQDEYHFIERLPVQCVANSLWDDGQIAVQMARRLALALADTVAKGASLHFHDRAEYLAAFLVALADGTAFSRWWFDEFDGLKPLSASTALRTVLINEGEVGVAALLSLTPSSLVPVLACLTEGDAARLLLWFETRPGPSAASVVDLWRLSARLRVDSAPSAWIAALIAAGRNGFGQGGAAKASLVSEPSLTLLRGIVRLRAIAEAGGEALAKALTQAGGAVLAQPSRNTGDEAWASRQSDGDGPTREAWASRQTDGGGPTSPADPRAWIETLAALEGCDVAWLDTLSADELSFLAQALAQSQQKNARRFRGPDAEPSPVRVLDGGTAKPAEWPEEVSEALAASGGAREIYLTTPFGGAFLLLARLAKLGWFEAWRQAVPEDSDELARALSLKIVAYALNPDKAAWLAADPALQAAWALGQPAEILRRAPRHVRAMLRASGSTAAKGDGRLLNRYIQTAAESLLDAFAAGLWGLATSSADYLRRNVLALPAMVHVHEKGCLVGLGRAPLDVLLALTGAKRGRHVLPGGFLVELREESEP